MIRSATHSGYPRIGESSFDQEIRIARRRRLAGRIDEPTLRDIEDRGAALVVAEQARAFVDIVTDGLVRWDGLVSRWTRHLGGLAPGAPFRWFDTPQFDRRPRRTGPVEWPGPLLVDEYRSAQDVAGPKTVKMVLPGPVTVGRLAEPRGGDEFRALVSDLAAATAAEVDALTAAGCAAIQIDEPLATRHPEDLDLVTEGARRAFDRVPAGTVTVVSVQHGDPAALGNGIAELPGTHVAVDAFRGDGWAAAVARLPPERGVHLGLWDSGSARVVDAVEVESRLRPHRDRLVGRDVIVGPNASLEPLPRDVAFDVLLQARYLAETLREDPAWNC